MSLNAIEIKRPVVLCEPQGGLNGEPTAPLPLIFRSNREGSKPVDGVRAMQVRPVSKTLSWERENSRHETFLLNQVVPAPVLPALVGFIGQSGNTLLDALSLKFSSNPLKKLEARRQFASFYRTN